MHYSCPTCITKKLVKVSGSWMEANDSEEDQDPMGESLADKNKLSKSEKSLKKPL